MDGSFANQVLAQIYLYERKFAALSSAEKSAQVYVRVLPKKLDEEVAKAMVEGFGGVLTRLRPEQAEYIHVEVDGPGMRCRQHPSSVRPTLLRQDGDSLEHAGVARDDVGSGS